LPLLGQWSHAGVELLEAGLFGAVMVCRELRKHLGPQGGKTMRTSRGD